MYEQRRVEKELHQLIDNMYDEELLSFVKEDIVAYQIKAKENFDDLSDLTPEERVELEELATEDPEKDTITEEEFTHYIQQWRNKLSTKKMHK